MNVVTTVLTLINYFDLSVVDAVNNNTNTKCCNINYDFGIIVVICTDCFTKNFAAIKNGLS